MDPPTHTHHNRTRIRTTSFIAEDNPHFATLAMQFHADRLFSRLDRLSPPRWKSQDELYEEANWKAGMRMTPCTPTPSGTPSPAATPYMFSIDKRYDTPESLSPPPFAHLTKHRGDYPIHSRTQSRKSSKSSISVSKPHRITKRIASKHSMVTRSRCGGNCLRHKSCTYLLQAFHQNIYLVGLELVAGREDQ
ncbi:hypothetical protein L207DRAFT_636951 [Hyaloscypha variabilis F]|uniref:Uncharacterized protein n=1 Tax=Hyaloscypha variabilis (strain UAMH 11265 / GT02V1 / F) TaxID=1149755 RepID=A0A2J6RF14_HYAVF|nr:hypothetical protein L207DRAFT_636951 [Hyaloscypha variabilis F]